MSEVEKSFAPPRELKRAWYAPWRGPGRLLETNIDLRQGRSLIAAAARIVSEKIKGGSQRRTEQWMAEAWTMYDIVGELHYLASTLSRRASKARFYVGKVQGSDVIELVDPATADASSSADTTVTAADREKERKVRHIFNALGDGFIGLQEVVERAFLNQFVVGSCYLVGAPNEVWRPRPGVTLRNIGEVPLTQLVWKTLSVSELVQKGDGYLLNQGGSASTSGGKNVEIPGSAIYIIALWTPHPNDASVPDSPVRATLPILRELVGLTQHISAQIDSRLAGAGMLVMRSSHSAAVKRMKGIAEEDASDPFTEMLVEAMITPIADRDSAAAVVPFVLTIPDGTDKPEFISFSSPLDQHAAGLREESIRRAALSLDAPPELLLGQGSTSHWTAWLTQEEVVDSHISPTLALIARGFSTEYLRALLRMNGFTAQEAEQYAIWYDTSELTVKANMAADAQALHALGLLADETVRRANGFDESDAPKKSDVTEQAIDIVRDMVIGNPGLMNRPGLDVLVEQVTALLNGKPQSGISASAAAKESSGSSEIPSAPEDAAETPAIEAPTAPRAIRAPQTTVSTPGLPSTRAAAQTDTEEFGSWNR